VVEENRLTEIIGQGEFDMFEWGWVVEPDPDYQLSTFTCGSRSYKSGGDVLANLSDSFYCNTAYDKLYEQQKITIDPAKRADIVKQMQKMLYDDAPYVVTFYYDELQAYRSDRFAGFQAQPDPGGVVLFGYGTYSYRNITTPQAAASAADDGGSGVPLIPIAIGVAVLGGPGCCWSCGAGRPRTSASRGRPRWPPPPLGPSARAPASAGWVPSCSGPCSAWPSCWCSTSSCSGCCPATRPRT
jgi:peptide/nickel transport system substrate-binding protein